MSKPFVSDNVNIPEANTYEIFGKTSHRPSGASRRFSILSSFSQQGLFQTGLPTI